MTYEQAKSALDAAIADGNDRAAREIAQYIVDNNLDNPNSTPEEPEVQNTWVDSVQARGTALLDGLTFSHGDEVSALMRSVVTGRTYDQELAQGRAVVQREKESNPGVMTGLEVISSVLPSAKLALSLPNAATRTGNMAAQGYLAAGEQVVREIGAAEGTLKERLGEIDGSNVALAGGLGVTFGSLMRGQNSIDEIAEAQSKAVRPDGTVTDAGLAQQSSTGAKIRNVRDSIVQTVEKEVGSEQARKMSTSDYIGMKKKQELHDPDVLPVNELDSLSKSLRGNGSVRKILMDVGAVSKGVPVFNEAQRLAKLDQAAKVLEGSYPEQAKTLRKVYDVIKVTQDELRSVFPNADHFQNGYFPISSRQTDKAFKGTQSGSARRVDGSTIERTTGEISEVEARDLWDDPVTSFMGFYEDAVDAVALARAYKVTSPVKTFGKEASYSEAVINSIAKSQQPALGKEGAARLKDNLKIFAIEGRESMNKYLNMFRVGSHAALLGTPENAVLQIGDLGAAVYATDLRSAIQGLPKAIRSVLLTDGDKVYGMDNVIRAADIGVTRQHLTEVVNQSREFWPKQVTKVADALMSASGVRKANRLGQETLLNSQYAQMQRLAKNGGLKDSRYGTGLTDDQLAALERQLLSGNRKSEEVLEASFYGMMQIQPAARSAMPRSYLEAKNGRLLWSMKSYMVKMASKFNSDVLQPAAQAEKAGFNTTKGKALLRKSVLNSFRYASYITAVNAIVDPGRKELFRGKENEYSFGQEFVRQQTGLATGGLIDPKLISEGINPAESMLPPAVQAPFEGVTAGIKMLQEGEVTPEQMKRASLYIPGVRQVIWADEVANR